MVNISDVGLDSMFDMESTSPSGSAYDNDLCWHPLSEEEVGSWGKLQAKLRQCGNYCSLDCTNPALGIRCGSAADKGTRHYMEDKVFSHASLGDVVHSTDHWHLWSDSGTSASATGVGMSLLNPEALSFFGVLDGHNGEYVADKLQSDLPRLLLHVLLGEVTRYFHQHYQLTSNQLNRVDTGDSICSSPLPSPLVSVRSIGSSGGDSAGTPSKKTKGFGFKKMFTFSSRHTSTPTSKPLCDGTSGIFSIPARYVHDTRADVDPMRNCLLKQCLLDCCALADREIVEYDFARQEKLLMVGRDGSNNNGSGGSIVNTHFAGCVGTMVIIADSCTGLDISYQRLGQARQVEHAGLVEPGASSLLSGQRKIFLANVGDCRTVLSEGGVALQLTVDHKPDLPGEKKRVEAAGGFVHKGRYVWLYTVFLVLPLAALVICCKRCPVSLWLLSRRVNGVLAVSRSFGDIMYRNYVVPVVGETVHLSASAYARAKVVAQNPSTAEEHEPDGLWNASTQPVIAKPDVSALSCGRCCEYPRLISFALS